MSAQPPYSTLDIFTTACLLAAATQNLNTPATPTTPKHPPLSPREQRLASTVHSSGNFAPRTPLPGTVVPQRVLGVSRSSAHITSLPPIVFSTGGKPGVSLQAALQLRIPGLDAAYSVRNVAWEGYRAGLHILWPGYGEWSLPGALTSRTKYGEQQTLAGLAAQVARAVQQFYDDVQATEGVDPVWRLQSVPFENLYLIELRMVSRALWQPIICVRLP